MRTWQTTVATAALLCAIALAGCQTVAPENGRASAAPGKSTDEIQAILFEQLEKEGPRFRSATGTAEREALREFVATLTRSKVFIESVTSIANADPGIGPDEFAKKLHAQARDAFSAGLVVLPPSDIEFILGNDLRILSAMDAHTCAQAIAALHIFGADGPYLRFETRENLVRALGIFETAYLGGLAKEPAPPMMTPEQAAEASTLLFAIIPPHEQAIVAAVTSNARTVSDEETCLATRAYRKALLDLRGQRADPLRRYTVVNGIRTEIVAYLNDARERAPSDVTGFTPGPVPLRYPDVALQERIEGRMRVRVWVDADGSPSQVKVVERSFNKPSIERNGVVVAVEDLFDPPVIVYLRAARFNVRLEDGKPAPYVAEVPIIWNLAR